VIGSVCASSLLSFFLSCFTGLHFEPSDWELDIPLLFQLIYHHLFLSMPTPNSRRTMYSTLNNIPRYLGFMQGHYYHTHTHAHAINPLLNRFLLLYLDLLIFMRETAREEDR